MTLSNASERPPSRILWPPLLFVAVIVGGRILDISLGLPRIGSGLTETAGAALCVLGLANDLWCALTLRAHKTTILPHRSVATLVTSGPYAYSRNPIYVSELVMTVGCGLLLRSPAIIVALPALFFGLRKLAIEPEERHLSAKFGAEFERFCAQTPRWL